VKIASYNIQYGVGRDGRYDLGRIAREVEGADIVALQEVTRGFSRNGFADMVAGLEALFPAFHSAFHAPVDIYLGHATVEGRVVGQRFQFGNMVLSRHPILSIRGLMLPRSLTYDRLNLQRSALECVIDAPGGAMRVYSVHLDHLSPDERIAQIEVLRQWLVATPQQGTAITGAVEFGVADQPVPEDYLALGDFNLQPDSPEYEALFGRRDAFYGRALRRDRPVDAMDRLGAYGPDSHSWLDEGGRRMLLDYALVSASLAPRLTKAWIDERAEGSDHLPLWVELA
jgi:endonuclease/exonuclease/phosphatase family metal-dependent hydrolase